MRRFLCAALIFGMTGVARASTSADILLTDADARTLSLAHATAADGDTAHFTSDPAVLALSQSARFFSTAGGRADGSKLYRLGLAGKSFGVHLSANVSPSEERLDETGAKIGTFSNSDTACTVAAAQTVGPLRIGVALTGLQKTVAERSSTGVSAGASVQMQAARRLMLGAALDHLTLSALKFGSVAEPFPSRIRAGAAFKALDHETLSLTLLSDAVAPVQGRIFMNGGAEMALNGAVFLRGGFSGETEGARLGIGIKLGRLRLDWAMQSGPMGGKEFSQVSLGWGF